MRLFARCGFFLSLLFAAVASASPATGTLSLTATAYSAAEGGSSVVITVDRTGGSTGAVSVFYTTVAGTATSSDYSPKNGRLYWNTGDTSPKTFSVPILDTDDFSGTKQFSVAIKDVYGGAGLGTETAAVAIQGNGGAGMLELSSSSYSVSQTLGSLKVVVNRTGGSAGTVSVFYATATGSAKTSDFSMKSGRLSWNSGDLSPKSFIVPISDAVAFAGTRQFTITIKDVYGAAKLGTPTTSTATIIGSAPSASLPPIPSIPSGLVATPGAGEVTLKWSTSSGATSYHVKRATTSGGPYSQIGAPTSSSYTDSSLTTGTTYYYVVSALDSAGESANSAQLSAQTSNPPPTSLGTWINVTPSGVDLTDMLDCQNYGTETVVADKSNPGTVYTEFMCQGIWKSTDYGQTWTGPINKGTNGAVVGDCAGGIAINPSSTMGGTPIIYESCIRGGNITGPSTSGIAVGFWISTDGGVSWTNYDVAASSSSRQDYYPPVIDPYDPTHLLMPGHEQDVVAQSTDGGHTWTSVPYASGMAGNIDNTGQIFFINTGSSSTTRSTWLWLSQQSGGFYGTWRTSNGGASWTQVDKNEHPHGLSQIYQPDISGVVYMAGLYSAEGNGILRSTNYGETWTQYGVNTYQTMVWGTSTCIYAVYGYPLGLGNGTIAPGFEIGADPGTGTYTEPGTPSGMINGGAQNAIINDGTHNIFLVAGYNGGLWRYVEP